MEKEQLKSVNKKQNALKQSKNDELTLPDLKELKDIRKSRKMLTLILQAKAK